MFVGDHDILATPSDTLKTKAVVKTTIFYEVFKDMDHSSFGIGKTMDFFPKAIEILD